MEFEWDPAKAARNLRKHGVSFREAETVFDDPLAVARHDEAHSVDEQRRKAIGISNRGRLVSVIYTWRRGVIRVISARKANGSETKTYTQA